MEGLHTIISSNIRFDNPADGVQCWDMRQSVLSNVLLSHHPFLIGTQEGRHSQHLEFSQKLTNYKLCAAHRPWIDERMYPCIYLLNDLTQDIQSGDAWLSETPGIAGSHLAGSAFPRLCTWVRLNLQGQSVVVLNLHLDFLETDTRMRQCEILCDEIKRQTTANDRVIIMGDFNDSPGSRVHTHLLDSCHKFYDPWSTQEEPSHHSFSGSAWQGQRIDWILLDRRLKCDEIFLDKTRQGQVWPSDHYPLVCRFRF